MTLEEAIAYYAKTSGVDPVLMTAMIMQESLRAAAKQKSSPFNIASPAGATGISQLMPATAAGLGVKDSTNPYQSLQGMGVLLQQLSKQFNGDTPRILAAYNAGPNAVKKYNGVPPYKETIRYVQRIMDDVAAMKAGAGASDQAIMDGYLKAAIPAAFSGAPAVAPNAPSVAAAEAIPPTANAVPVTSSVQQPAAIITPQAQPAAPVVPASVPNVTDYTVQANNLMSQIRPLQTTVATNPAMPQADLAALVQRMTQAAPAGNELQGALNAANSNIPAQQANVQTMQSLAANLPTADFATAYGNIAAALQNQQSQRDALVQGALQEAQQNDQLARSTMTQVLNNQNFNPLDPNSEYNGAVADERQILRRMRATAKAEQEMGDATLLNNPAMAIERMLFGNQYKQGGIDLQSQFDRIDGSTAKLEARMTNQVNVANKMTVPSKNFLTDFLPYNLDSTALAAQAAEKMAMAPVEQARYDLGLGQARMNAIGDVAQMQNNVVAQQLNAAELGLKQSDLQMQAASAPLKAALDAAQLRAAEASVTGQTLQNQVTANSLVNAPVMQKLDVLKAIAELESNGLSRQATKQSIQKGALDYSVASNTAGGQVAATNATNAGIAAATPATTEATIAKAGVDVQQSKEFKDNTLLRQTLERARAESEIAKARIEKGVISMIGEPAMIKQEVTKQQAAFEQAKTAITVAKSEGELNDARQKALTAEYQAKAKTAAIVASATVGEATDSIAKRDKLIEQQTRLGVTFSLLGGQGDLPPLALTDPDVTNALEAAAQAGGVTAKGAARGRAAQVGANTAVAATIMNKLGLVSANNVKYPAIQNGMNDAYRVAVSKLPKDTEPRDIDKAIAALSQESIRVAFGAEEGNVMQITGNVRPSTSIYGMLPSGSIAAQIKNPTLSALVAENSVALDQAGTYIDRIAKLSELTKDMAPAQSSAAIAEYFSAAKDANNALRGYDALGIPAQKGIYVSVPDSIPFMDIDPKIDITTTAGIARLRGMNKLREFGANFSPETSWMGSDVFTRVQPQ